MARKKDYPDNLIHDLKIDGVTVEDLDFSRLTEREKAIKAAQELVGEPVEVIDSFFQSAPADARPLWFLGKSLELLSTADVAYFAEGWQDARGCRIEHECAKEYGIDRIEPQEVIPTSPQGGGVKLLKDGKV